MFVRRSDIADVDEIVALTSGDTESLLIDRFGHIDVSAEIERAVLSITAHDEEGRVMGFASFCDYPRIMEDAVPADGWEEWFAAAYEDDKNTAENCVWLSTFIANETVQHDVATQVFTAAFSTMPVVNVILLALARGVPGFSPLQDVFESLPPPTEEAKRLPYRICAASRDLYVPRLHVRPAHVEDNDDLTPIFNDQSQIQTGVFGEFFLADLIERQDDHNHVLAAEMDGRAVGLMAVSADVDVEVLRQCFELDAFGGLMRGDGDVVDDESSVSSAPDGAEDGAVDTSDNDFLGGVRIAGVGGSPLSDGDGTGAAPPKKAFPAADQVQLKVPQEPVVNAFCVSWFCLDENFHSRSFDFLEAAFALFPDRDYCVLTLPHDAREVLLLRFFTPVDAKPDSTLPHALYVMHRFALMNSIRARRAKKEDAKYIARLVAGLDDGQRMLQEYDDILRFETMEKLMTRPREPLHKKVFVAECAGNVVAMAVVSSSVDLAVLRRTFHVEYEVESKHHRTSESAALLGFALNPIFFRHSRFILQEILRVFNKTCLYLSVSPGQVAPRIVDEFVQLRPRVQLQYSGKYEGLNDDADPYALFLFARKRVHEPKLTVNARIVVVGASDVGLAFLEHLSSMSYLNFTNLTLVSPGGLPTRHPDASHGLLPHSHVYSHRSLARIALDTSVRVVDGMLAQIDRHRSAIILADGAVVPYEKLVLTPGMQFFPLFDGVNGLLSVNNEMEAEEAYAHVQAMEERDPRHRVVVFGGTVEAYTAVAGLLKMGISGQQITLAVPPADVSCFAEPTVDQMVSTALEKAGVSVLRSYTVADVEHTEGVLSAVVFQEWLPGSEGAQKRLACSTLLTAVEKDVDAYAFSAVNQACLVYDGRLVIDNNFRTIDPQIYGAGPVTKFANQLHTRPADCHEFFNSREIGIRLAMAVKEPLDPVAGGTGEVTLAEWELPTYLLPKVVGAVLPGNLYYYRLLCPSLLAESRTNPDAAILDDWKGSELRTLHEGRYCRVLVDGAGLVKAITMLLPAEGEGAAGVHVRTLENLIWLFNLPDTYLNSLSTRFYDGRIADLSTVFNEPWMAALYQGDAMVAAREDMRAALMGQEAMVAMAAELRDIVEATGTITPEQKAMVRQKHLGEAKMQEIRELVQSMVIQNVEANHDLLPMYHIPAPYVTPKTVRSPL